MTLVLFFCSSGALCWSGMKESGLTLIFGNGILFSVFIAFLFVYKGDARGTFYTQVGFGSALLGFNATWAALFYHSFFYAAVFTAVTIELIKIAAWTVNKPENDLGYYGLGSRFIAWLAICAQIALVAKGYEAIRKSLSGLRKKERS